MSEISDVLRDSAGTHWNISPTTSGELTIASQDPVEDEWTDETYTSDSWTDVSY